MIVLPRAARWVDDRLRISRVSRTALSKVFPDHWTFMMGEIALYSFVVLVGTGIYLTLFFQPSMAEKTYDGSYAPLYGQKMSAAYASTVELSWDVRGGLLMRQAHHWAALIFLGAIFVHLCRIYFTAAFRRPREINWVIGLTMLILGMLNGFAGYSLPDDLLSATGLRVANAVLLSMPVVGPWLAFFLFGSEFPGDQVVSRLYPVHVLLIPGLLIALITAHMGILIRQKHTHFPGKGRRDSNVVGSTMWPTYAFRSISLLCGVTGVCFLLGGLAQINPVWLWGPFEPGSVLAPAQPDWYVGWIDGGLRAYPAWDIVVSGHRIPGLFVPAVVFPTVLFLVMYAWPWIDKLITSDDEPHHVLARPRRSPLRAAVGVYVIALFVVLLLTSGSDIFARYAQLPVASVLRVLRVVILIAPLVLALVAWFVTRALRDSEAEHLAEMEVRAVTGAVPLLRKVPPPPVEAGAEGPPQPVAPRQPVESSDGPEGWEAEA